MGKEFKNNHHIKTLIKKMRKEIIKTQKLNVNVKILLIYKKWLLSLNQTWKSFNIFFQIIQVFNFCFI